MIRVVLFDSDAHAGLKPLTLTRAVCDIRVGITTIREKWSQQIQGPTGVMTQIYLQDLYLQDQIADNALYIDGSIIPTAELWAMFIRLNPQESINYKGRVIAYMSNERIHNLDELFQRSADASSKEFGGTLDYISFPEDILRLQEKYLRLDYEMLTAGRESAEVEKSNYLRGDQIFIEPSAQLFNVILNATEGPIYIGENTEIMEGAVIKGPVAIGKGTKIHVGAKIYSNTVMGPECRIGGEVKRTCFIGYANKGHEGFLGDSVVGSWCNFGADSNCSNMKNTYGEVSLWDMEKQDYRKTGRQFCGIVMGDHSMCAINTAFTTGSVTGVFANIFGGNPPRFCRSFSWGMGSDKYDIAKALEVARRSMSRRSIELSSTYESVLRFISDHD